MRIPRRSISQVALLLLTHLSSSVSSGIKHLGKNLEIIGDVSGDPNGGEVAGLGMPKNFDRDLQQYSCDETINVFPSDVVKQIVGSVLTQSSAIPEVASILSEMVPILEHDVQMIKVLLTN